MCSDFLSVEDDLNKINTDLQVSKRLSNRQLHNQINFLAGIIASMIDVVHTKLNVLENFSFNYSAQKIMSLREDFVDFENRFDIRRNFFLKIALKKFLDSPLPGSTYFYSRFVFYWNF